MRTRSRRGETRTFRAVVFLLVLENIRWKKVQKGGKYVCKVFFEKYHSFTSVLVGEQNWKKPEKKQEKTKKSKSCFRILASLDWIVTVVIVRCAACIYVVQYLHCTCGK